MGWILRKAGEISSRSFGYVVSVTGRIAGQVLCVCFAMTHVASASRLTPTDFQLRRKMDNNRSKQKRYTPDTAQLNYRPPRKTQP